MKRIEDRVISGVEVTVKGSDRLPVTQHMSRFQKVLVTDAFTAILQETAEIRVPKTIRLATDERLVLQSTFRLLHKGFKSLGGE